MAWEEHIDELAFAYNSTIYDTTGVNYGRHPNLPGSLHQKEALECLGQLDREDLKDWKSRMPDLCKVNDVVSSCIKKAQDRQARYYNARHKEVTFEIGDIVLRRYYVLSSAAKKVTAKSALKSNGPYVVTAKIGKNVYEIKDRLGETCGPVHVKDLKRYYSDQMEFYENDEDQDIQEEINSPTLNKSLKTKTTSKTKPRGRSR